MAYLGVSLPEWLFEHFLVSEFLTFEDITVLE